MQFRVRESSRRYHSLDNDNDNDIIVPAGGHILESKASALVSYIQG